MIDQEFQNCTNCNQPTIERVEGAVYKESCPITYPTKCTTCGWTGHSEKLIDRQAFNQTLKQTEAET
jgi:hypothetical protein